MYQFCPLLLSLGLLVVAVSCQSAKETSVESRQEIVSEKQVLKPMTVEEKVASIADQYQVKIGVMAKNLTTKKTISINARERIPVTSMLKVPILISYYEAVKTGKLKPDQMVRLSQNEKVGGSGFLQYMSNDLTISLKDAARLSVIASDNTAANLVIESFGNNLTDQIAFVNQVMSQYGWIDTKLLNKFLRSDLKTNSDEAKKFGVGFSTAVDLSNMMEIVYSGSVFSSSATQEILEAMRNANDDSMSPRFLPMDDTKLSLAHRSGGTTRYKGDFGLITYQNQAVSFAVICENLTDFKPTIENNGTLAVGLITKIIFEELTQL